LLFRRGWKAQPVRFAHVVWARQWLDAFHPAHTRQQQRSIRPAGTKLLDVSFCELSSFLRIKRPKKIPCALLSPPASLSLALCRFIKDVEQNCRSQKKRRPLGPRDL